MTTVLATSSPASDAQIKFLRNLLAEKLEDPAEALAWLDTHKLSKADASAKITEYKAMPTVNRAAELDEGMYQVGEDIYKVYFTRGSEERAPQLVTKQLIEGRFEYKGKRPLLFITAEHRMTLEQAMEYGQITGTCCNCGRLLTNEESIANGIGPICASKF